ncbi:MAG: glycosyltransferase, partial [Bacteroidetes bacterium]|nr:glycosyltransferase [Bacteroidota bacterium]
RLYHLYIRSGLLTPRSDTDSRIAVLKEGRLMHWLYKQLYCKQRLKWLYIFIQRIVVLFSLRSNHSLLKEVETLHAVLDGVRYIPFIRHLHPGIHCFASVVDPTLAFNVHKARLFGLKNCDHIDSLNINIRAELLRLGFDETRISVTPASFTDYNIIQPGRKKPRVAFCARLIKPKNPLVFIDIADRFAEKYPGTDLEFVVLGDGPLKADIDQRIETKPVLKKMVTAPGYVPKPADVFAESLIFVQLSDTEIHGTQSMLEAMGTGCYIMVSHLDGIENVVKDDFGAILPLDANVFADHIKKRVDEFDATVEAGQAARRYGMRNFHVSNFLDYLFSVYARARPNTDRHGLFTIVRMALVK